MYRGGGRRPSPTAINPDTRLLDAYETKMATRASEQSTRSLADALSEKIGGCERSTFNNESHVFFSPQNRIRLV